ncbi:hypothetical protein BU23DRAFT_337123 [Bimuria novae-zelandiae CBS 107.79]|uniref:Uncharacterized protein n=1 Tax=Bimuria novae-zelandiae CBS 107.79 TaxID=1447943 RepID=A0A6A5UPL5_9PLEO|nr:hypothetical protein BU23DRAFT_337123 [Bimuria novae-zelandiae CBS 107.79]
MSSSERPPEQSVPTTNTKRKHLSDDDQEDLDRLDGIFKRLKTAAPRAPYILATPSLNPYRYHSSHEARAWMLGHLFRPEEEYLQYRTFLFREPYRDCFTLQPGEDDEPEPPRPRSQASNPTNQGPKKKISLADYKNKQANGVSAPSSKKMSPALQPTKPTLAQSNGVKPKEKQDSTRAQEKNDTAQSVRPEKKLPEKPEKRDLDHKQHATKPESAEFKINIDKSGPSNATPHGLPPLLSPVDQPLNNPHGLPTILSPTLPPNVLKELEKLETQRKRSDSNTSTSSSDRNKSQHLHVPERTALKRPASAKDGEESQSVSRARSVPVNGKSPNKEIVDPIDDSESGLLVKLKYTKKSRETIKRLLALPPRRESPAERKDREEQVKSRATQAQPKIGDGVEKKAKPIPKVAARRPEASATASKTPIPSIKVAEKRPRTEDDTSQASSVKRPRTSTVSSQDRPITPRDQIISSPAASTKSSTQKGQGAYLTPRKDLKAVNMLRTNSSESHDSTPGRSGATPTSSQRLDPKAPTSAPPLSSKKQMDMALLQQFSKHLNQMGRSLKHEGQKLEREKAGRLTKTDQEHAAVIGLECIVSYMAAYHAQDQALQLRGRSGEVEHTWMTLLPLCSSYGRLTKDFQHLEGFRSYLAAVIAANICTLVAPRAPNPRAHDSPHELSVAELTKQHSQLTENLNLLSDHYQKLLRHTQDARAALPMDELEKQYPRTCASAKEFDYKLAKAPEKINSTKLSGPYFLPIQNDTTPIQAVRFGVKFLTEYCEKECIDHKLKINLDRPE